MRTEDAFRSVQQMQARLRIETPWVCTNYFFPHELTPADAHIYEELKVQLSPYTFLYVCIHCLGVRRKHKAFRFIDNRYPIERRDLPPFPNVRDVTT